MPQRTSVGISGGSGSGTVRRRAARAARWRGPGELPAGHVARDGSGRRAARQPGPISAARRWTGLGLAILLPALVTAHGVLGPGLVDPSSVAVLDVLAVVVVALVGGLGPALLAAVVAGTLLNFFFTEPRFTLLVAEDQDVITLVVMLVVAVLVALVVDRAGRRAEQAARARAEAALLASFSRTMLTRPDPLPRLLEQVRTAFSLTSVAVVERRDGGWSVSASAGAPACGFPDRADVDVAVDPDVHLVAQGRSLAAADRRLLETAAGQAMLALRHQQVAAEAAEARRRAEAGQLRTALLSAVGHDLRTPLTSIKTAAGTLRDPTLCLSEHDRTELAATVEQSADRLSALVANLLDSSRLVTGAVAPQLGPVACDEVVDHALAGLDDGGRVEVDIDERLPEVLADPGLLDRVVANVVDNALRHGDGAPVSVRAEADGDRVELRVVDTGPGIPPERADRLFSPFQRLGDRHAGGGLGLGLSVARGFTEAMGGTLGAEDTPGGGCTIVVGLPVAPAGVLRSAREPAPAP